MRIKPSCFASCFLLLLVILTYTEWRVKNTNHFGKKEAMAGKAAGSNLPSAQTLPVVFEPNEGQFKRGIGFVARGNGYQAMLAADEATLEIRHKASATSVRTRFSRSKQRKPQGINRLPGYSNYLQGNQPAQWHTGVAHFEQVSYRDVYEGIDLLFYSKQGQLEYDFLVAPEADPSDIHLIFDHAQSLRLAANGDLLIAQQSGEIRHHKPSVYQQIKGSIRVIEAAFTLSEQGEVGFKLGPYDRQQALVIDPAISYSALLGGSNTDAGQSIAVDAAGNAYIAGVTNSDDFQITPGIYRNTMLGGEAFVAKINPTGTSLLYATYLGGSGFDRALGLAVDTSGNAYLTGSTTSPDFPVTAGALRRTFAGGEVFVTKLNSTGSALLYSTFLGGSSNDIGYAISLDNTGNAYVAGSTSSSNFPVTQNAVKNNISGVTDAFVAKINSTGSALVYATLLGGSNTETAFALALDNANNAYLAGNTSSADFPVSTNAFQKTYAGNTGLSDAFVAKVNSTGTALLYATYLGGADADSAYGLAVDTAGNAYVTGDTGMATTGSNFPVTTSALQTTFGGGEPPSDAFVTKLNTTGSALVYSTLLGGNGTDKGTAIAVDQATNAYLTGLTASSNLVAAGGGMGVYGDNVDAFVAGLNPTGTGLTYFTYLGGGSNDIGSAIALSATGELYVTGASSSAAFPLTPGTLRARTTNEQNAFITRIGVSGASAVTSVSAASFTGPRLAAESIVAAFGTRLATQTAVGGDADPSSAGIQLPTTLAGTQVLLRDSAGLERAAPLFFVSPEQINYQIPAGLAQGTAAVTVRSGDGALSLGTIQIVSVSPGIFTFSGSGQGVPAGLALRVKADNTQSFEPIGELNAQNRWVTRPIDAGASTDRIFLVLFGTGWRFRNDNSMTAQIGGVAASVEYAGAQGVLVGLDQTNILLPRTLAGRGQITVALTANGIATNPVTIEMR